MKPKRILLAENEPKDAAFIQGFLEDAGYYVEAVNNSKQAWELLQSCHYDLFMCNFNLTNDINGWQLMAKMYQSGMSADCPIIAIFNYPADQDIMWGNRHWDSEIHKPELLDAEQVKKFLVFLKRLLNVVQSSQ